MRDIAQYDHDLFRAEM